MRTAPILMLIFAFAAGIVLPASAQTMFRPVAVVNDSAITGFDLQQRVRILETLGFAAGDEASVRSEAVDQLIDDRLKLRAGVDAGIRPSETSRSDGEREFARRLGTTPEAFVERLRGAGVSEQAIDDLVIPEIIWIQVVRARFLGRIEPGEGEIDAEIELTNNRSGISYRVLEIGLPDTAGGRSRDQTQALADRLSTELNAGGDFRSAVQQYSQAPSAANGGDVGWITTAGLPGPVVQTLSSLELGQVSPPIPVTGGVTLLKLVDKRQSSSAQRIDPDDPETRNQIRSRIVNEQIVRLADGLLQEMRRDAMVEVR